MIMKTLRRPLLIASAMTLIASTAHALPTIGAAVPKRTAYDADGQPFDLAERLKGQYSVVVFGCLT